MAKRFTESGKFRDAWYRNLSPKGKCIWEFMISECNAAGILDIDLKSITFHIGVPISMKDIKAFDDRLVWIREDKVFIPKFIKFQYPGGLNPDNRAHKNILPMLEEYVKFDEKEGAWKPLARPLQGPKEKETEQVQVTETVQETETTTSANDNNLEETPAEPPVPKENPDAGTFRMPGKTPRQIFACWYIQTIFPETYRISDKEATAEWFRRYGKALTSVMTLAGEDVELLKDVTYAAAEDMKKFSQTQGENIPPSLELIGRNWDKYLAKAGIMRKKREAETRQREVHLRQEEAKRKREEAEAQAYADRLAKTVLTDEEREKVLKFTEKIGQTITSEKDLKEAYLYMKDTNRI